MTFLLIGLLLLALLTIGHDWGWNPLEAARRIIRHHHHEQMVRKFRELALSTDNFSQAIKRTNEALGASAMTYWRFRLRAEDQAFNRPHYRIEDTLA